MPSWRQVLGLFAFVVALGVGTFVVLYATTEVPNPDDFARAQASTVYFADGTTEMGTFSEQNRVIVGDDAIPEHVKQAVVAAEDRTFYENPGINPVGIVRALWNNVRGGQQQGGSSITQQYAERYYLGETVRDYRGKLKEAILAIKLDRLEDKDEILVNYLNTIYWGRGSYGIETAAQSYFGVSASELTVEQAALLAGIIPSPNNWDPRVSPEDAERRFRYVVDGMVTTGALEASEAASLQMPETIEQTRTNTLGGPNGYILAEVRKEIVNNSAITDEQLDRAGLRIVTTIDPEMQAAAVATMQAMPEDTPEYVRRALVTLEPGTGAIRAMFGGDDYVERQFNDATQATMQAGSTFKPFTLVGYLEEGGSLKSVYRGPSPMELTPDWSPRNFGNQSYGSITVAAATANSVNTVYGQMNLEIGPEKTVDVAVRAGVPEDTAGLQPPTLANVLGTASPTPLAMASAFNTFAAQGVRATPYLVETVEYLSDGAIAYQGKREPERVFEEDVMADTTYALTRVVEEGSGTKAKALGRPVAGKTGTSQENVSAWFIGYTPQLTTAVAVFGADEDGTVPMEPFGGYREITGSSVPLDLWTEYMEVATEGMEVVDFPARADVGEPNLVEVPKVTGLTEAEARARLEAAGFRVAVEQGPDDAPEGVVYAVSPTGLVASGTTITIMVSTGPEEVEVPDVVGRSRGDAVARLEQAGFQVAVEEREDDAREGTVVDQSPRGGRVEAGSTVRIVVSVGRTQVEPPSDTPEPPESAEDEGGDPEGPGDGEGQPRPGDD